MEAISFPALRSDLDRAEAARLKTMERLVASERVATVGRLVQSIMHEINNPLDVVGLQLYMLEQLDLPEDARKRVESARNALSQAHRIARNTLDFSRESTRETIVSIDAIATSVHDLYQTTAMRKGVKLNLVKCDENCYVKGFPGEIRQVLANIVRNAIESAPEKGAVMVRVKKVNSSIKVSIADNGRGISSSVRRKLGEPFFTTKGEAGTGLGLWISKEIVQKHSGHLRMRNRLKDRGAVFTIEVPALRVVPQAQGVAA